MLSIFRNFSRAFDIVDHVALCQILNFNGVTGFMSDLTKSYPTNRLQNVNIGDSYSNTASIKLGLPQGSILGPLLFLIYMNDMHKSTELSVVHYADQCCSALVEKVTALPLSLDRSKVIAAIAIANDSIG